MGLGRAFGNFFGNVGDAAGSARSVGRGATGAGGNAASGAARAAARDVPLDVSLPKGSDARKAAALDPNNPNVPSREGGGDPPKVGDTWKPLKYALGAAVVGVGVTVTAIMLKKSIEGAQNDGKTYNVKLIKNKSATGTILVCQFSPSVEPNGVVVNDSITFSGTGTFLDGNEYTVVTRSSSHSSFEFDASKRLSAEVNNKGTFVLHTSFENQMDNQANNVASGLGGLLNNLFGGLFGGLFGDLAGPLLVASLCCFCLFLCLILLYFISR